MLYGILFSVALIMAYTFHHYIDDRIGNSLMIGKMISGFNYTLYTDFMNHYGVGANILFNQNVFLILIYLVISVFLMGGILGTYRHHPEKYESELFWSKAGSFFGRMLRVTLFFGFIHALIFFIFWQVYFMVIQGGSPYNLENEGIIFSAPKFIIPIYILVASFFFMWHDYAKISLIHQEHKWVFRSILNSLKFVLKNIGKTWGLYLLNVILIGLLFLVNYFIGNLFEISNTATIFLSFLCTQIFVILRLGFRLINLSSANALFTTINKVKKT